MNILKKRKGLTYTEVIISLFILLFVTTLFIQVNGKLNHMKYQSNIKESMLYTAQNIVELYKKNEVQSINQFKNGYYVEIKETPINENLIKVLIIVKENESSDLQVPLGTYILKSDILKWESS